MSDSAVITRFAPSPTGDLHLGNARTALFGLLLARHRGGRFVLRIEDTDAARSREVHTHQLMDDLRWLGIEWDAGPDKEDGRGPYLQSARGAWYAERFAALVGQGRAYECYCTPLELELSRKAQAAAGRAPRYSGTCRALAEPARLAKRATGAKPTLRFEVPSGRVIEFADFVHGPQSFASDDIGDFVIRRSEGSPAFFFCNAVDDAAMGVTHVLRGEDHLTNTPRQLLILEALAMRAPAYGHVSLIVGDDGAPLSKRHGAASVREYRERGYLPQALLNHLFRLGHSSAEHGVLSLEAMARAFDVGHLGRAPSRFDEQQLDVWQKSVAHQLSPEAARAWLAAVLPPALDEGLARAFIEAVLPNIVRPAQAQEWVQIIYGSPPQLSAEDEQLVRAAGPAYFSAGRDAAQSFDNDYAQILAAIKSTTGRKGAELFRPLRLALTGRAHGPELAPLLRAMLPGAARERLARFA